MRHRKKKDLTLTLAEISTLHTETTPDGYRVLVRTPDPAVDPTWHDLEHRARYCPVVAALFAEVRAGSAREVAMIRALLRLSRQYQELRDAALEVARAERPPEAGW